MGGGDGAFHHNEREKKKVVVLSPFIKGFAGVPQQQRVPDRSRGCKRSQRSTSRTDLTVLMALGSALLCSKPYRASYLMMLTACCCAFGFRINGRDY